MLRPDQDEFYSPIVSSAGIAHIDTDNFKLFMMPELPSRISLEVEPKPLFDQLDNEFEIFPANSRGSNNGYHKRSHNWDCDSNLNLQCVSFDESITTNATIDDFISDYQDSDIELMQEALLVLIDDDEEGTFFSGDRCNLHDKCNVIENHLTKKCPDFTHFPVRSTQHNHQNCREVNHRMTAGQDNKTNSGVKSEASIDIHRMTAGQDNNTNSGVKSEAPIDFHPLLLPVVTFDEEEEFDRRNFFDQEQTIHQRSENESVIRIASPQSCNEPSHWLLRQLTLDNLSIQQSLSHTPMDSAQKSKNARGINKGGICASVETKHKHWSEEEDKALKLAAKKELVNPIDWIKIARNYFNNTRSATQCKNRWKNYLKPGVIRGNWQKQEDEYTVSMVSQGFKWIDIAKGLPGRTGEHVRERFVNVLDDKLKKTCWTQEEDKILFHHQRILGNKWSEIRKLLPGRSDNSIKNRYHNRRNAHLRRQKRESSEKKSFSSL